MTKKQDLFDKGVAVRETAYAPYSGFKVGAALLARGGAIYAGCNVENVAYPQGQCAEAGAIAAMIAGGDTEISAVLVVADSDPPVTPCGGCRQRLAEFGGAETPVYLADLNGIQTETTLGNLLPLSFGAQHMENTDGA